MDDKERGLLNQYPNLEGLYEHVKDTLSKESQALSDLIPATHAGVWSTKLICGFSCVLI